MGGEKFILKLIMAIGLFMPFIMELLIALLRGGPLKKLEHTASKTVPQENYGALLHSISQKLQSKNFKLTPTDDPSKYTASRRKIGMAVDNDLDRTPMSVWINIRPLMDGYEFEIRAQTDTLITRDTGESAYLEKLCQFLLGDNFAFSEPEKYLCPQWVNLMLITALCNLLITAAMFLPLENTSFFANMIYGSMSISLITLFLSPIYLIILLTRGRAFISGLILTASIALLSTTFWIRHGEVWTAKWKSERESSKLQIQSHQGTELTHG